MNVYFNKHEHPCKLEWLKYELLRAKKNFVQIQTSYTLLVDTPILGKPMCACRQLNQYIRCSCQ